MKWSHRAPSRCQMGVRLQKSGPWMWNVHIFDSLPDGKFSETAFNSLVPGEFQLYEWQYDTAASKTNSSCSRRSWSLLPAVANNDRIIVMLPLIWMEISQEIQIWYQNINFIWWRIFSSLGPNGLTIIAVWQLSCIYSETLKCESACEGSPKLFRRGCRGSVVK